MIICGDALEEMKKMRDSSVDFVFTDPPYNVGKDYEVYKDNLSEIEYNTWITEVLCEINRISKTACIYTPHKYALHYWYVLGPGYKQIILSYSPEGAIRFGFVNQFSFLLTNAKPNQYCKNVWHNCQMPGLGWFFRENTYGCPGYTSEEITRRAIANLTNPNDLVFDPFSGVGTTQRCCKDLGRRFEGIELNPNYIKIAKKRLAQEVLPLNV